jgi:hypothetical protein
MKFIKKNKYYRGIVYEWNLPTGHTCPFANECLVKVNRETGKFSNESNAYRCYAASSERFPAVRDHRWKNFEFIQSGGTPLIPKDAKSIRIHASGDFFNQKYFDMWLDVCRENPDVEFWAYTKSLKYWINRINEVPSNLTLTASRGGKSDDLIDKHNLKNATVIKSKSEAIDKPIDYNDDEARKPSISFYLLDNNIKH